MGPMSSKETVGIWTRKRQGRAKEKPEGQRGEGELQLKNAVR